MAVGDAELSARATQAAIRAEVAEARLATLMRLPRWWDDERFEFYEREVQRLRQVVERQQAEVARLRVELAEARTRHRQVPLRTLVRSLLAAVEDGSLAFGNYAIAGLQAELKALLQIADGEGGLFIGHATAHDPSALSTIRLEVSPLPTGDEVRARRLALAIDALLELQRALDRPLGDATEPAGVAIGALGEAVERATDPADLARRLVPVEAPLGRIADRLPELAAAVNGFRQVRAALAGSGGAAQLDQLTSATLALARELATAS